LILENRADVQFEATSASSAFVKADVRSSSIVDAGAWDLTDSSPLIALA
jgi:hypothetical protein